MNNYVTEPNIVNKEGNVLVCNREFKPAELVIYDDQSSNRDSVRPLVRKSKPDSEFETITPLLNIIDFKTRDTLGVRVGNNRIESINTDIEGRQLNSNALYNRLNITINDVITGSIPITLNFTDQPITIFTKDNIPKKLVPIGGKLKELYNGSIILLKVNYYNNPYKVGEEGNFEDYIESRLRLYGPQATGKNHKLTNMGRLSAEEYDNLVFLSKHMADFKNEPSSKSLNCMTVVSTMRLSNIYTLPENLEKGVYVPTAGYIISTKPLTSHFKFPMDDRLLPKVSDIIESLPGGKIITFIVDRENSIGPKYTTVAGKVIQIPKIDVDGDPDGLYVVTNKTKTHLTLEELRCSPYVYNSIEEAEVGGDVNTAMERQQKINELDKKLQLQKLELEQAYRREELESIRYKDTIDRLQKEKEFEEGRYEQRVREMELKMEEMERQRRLNKERHHTERMRYVNDSNKFSRDVILDSIKTTGAILGSAAGAYLAYTKLRNI